MAWLWGIVAILIIAGIFWWGGMDRGWYGERPTGTASAPATGTQAPAGGTSATGGQQAPANPPSGSAGGQSAPSNPSSGSSGTE
jgi:hypothetical protein